MFSSAELVEERPEPAAERVLPAFRAEGRFGLWEGEKFLLWDIRYRSLDGLEVGILIFQQRDPSCSKALGKLVGRPLDPLTLEGT